MIIHRLLTIFVEFGQPDRLGFIIILQIGFQPIVAIACIGVDLKTVCAALT